MKAKILIGEDDRGARDSLQALLVEEGYCVHTAADGVQVANLAEQIKFDAVLLDVRMPGKDGLSLLREIREQQLPPAILIMTAYGNSSLAIEAMKLGAYDYLTKPLHFEEVLIQLQRAITNRVHSVTDLNSEELPTEDVELVGHSAAMQQVYKLIGQVAATDSTVLIRGESGTGKELIARAIHLHSLRRGAHLVTVHCAAIPETLVEAELFGYEKGAFTGALMRRKGKFERADGGTLFLDEIGELPPATQSKLLRFLQERTIEPLGSDRHLQLNVRILAATNQNLEESVTDGAFRPDLFYRLNVLQITAPPLRDRREDIPELAIHILKSLVAKKRLRPATFTNSAIEILRTCAWPGNVRELEHAIERAVILANGSSITPDLLSPSQSHRSGDLFEDVPLDEGLHTLVAKLERSLIKKALTEAGGNRTRAAEILRINRRLLYEKTREFGID
jgi:two-component system, NtrC family, response regulator AtoC